MPTTVWDETPANSPKTIIASYDASDNLIGVLHLNTYSQGSVTTASASSSGVSKVRAYVWEFDNNYAPISLVKEFEMP